MNKAILYSAGASNFFNQGIGPLTEAKNPRVTQVGNGEFILEMDYPVSGELFNQLKNGNLIKADAGHDLKEQRFEIKRVVKSKKQGHVYVYAEHISYHAADISMPPNVTLSGTALNALRQAQTSGLGNFKPFTMSSNITTNNETKLSIRDVKNLKQALAGVQSSILDTWGGEYLFDNYHITLFRQRGQKANAMIAYGRNLIDLEQEESIMNTFTSVYPYAVWRDDEGVEEIISGSIVHSEHVDKYDHEKVLPVDFSLDFDEDKPTATKLNELAAAYIDNNDIGVPEVSIRLTHLDLSKTLDYVDYKEAEKLNLFDSVSIYFEKFDINTMAKIVKTVWNINLERYDEIEVGKVRANMADRFNSISNEAKAANKEASDARNYSLVAANGVNMVFFGPDEPTSTKVGDRWFEENGQYTISRVWDGVIWRIVNDPRITDANKQAIEDAQTDIQDAKDSAAAANQQINDSIQNAGFTSLNDLTANLRSISKSAQLDATDALSNSVDALSNAQSALSGLSNVQSFISDIHIDINEIEGTLALKASQTDLSSVTGIVDQHTLDIQANAQGLSFKADSSTVDTLSGTVDSLSTEVGLVAGELSSMISQTQLDGTLAGIQSEWTQTFNSFQSTVSDLEGNVSIQEQTISSVSQSITDAEGNISTLQQNVNGLQTTVASKASQTQVTQLATGYNVLVEQAISAYRVRTNNYGNGAKGYIKGPQGNDLVGGSVTNDRNFMLVVINANDEAVFSDVFDIYSFPSEVDRFIATVNGYNDTYLMLVAGSHASEQNRRLGIKDVIYDLGGSPEVFETLMATRSGYLLVGKKGLGMRNGYENYSPLSSAGLMNVLVPVKNGTSSLIGGSYVMNSQLSVLENSINLRVTKGSLLSEINLQAGTTLISSNKLLLNAASVVFSGTAFIPNAYLQNISADKITTGTLNASDVNLINLNVSKLVGNTTDFVRSAWSAIASSVSISATTGVRSVSGSNEVNMYNGALQLKSSASGTPTEVKLDGVGLDFTTASSTATLRFNGTNLVLDNANLGLNYGHINSVSWIRMIGDYDLTIHKHPTASGGAIVDSSMVTIGLGVRNSFSSIAQFYGRIDFHRNLHMNNNDIQSVLKVSLNNSNSHLISHHNGNGAALVDSTRLTMGIGSITTGFNDRIVVTNSQIDLYAHANVRGNRLDRVARMELEGTNGYYMHLSSGTAVVDTRMVTIATGNPTGVTRVADFYGRIDFYKNLDMKGNSISNQSDERLKTAIVDNEIDSLKAIKYWRMAGFNWIDPDYTQDRQFSVIAQSAPEIAFEDNDGYLSVNGTKQLSMVTHGLQQLATEHDNTLKVASHAYLLAEQHEDELAYYKKKIEELEEKIERLEGAA